MAEDAPQSAPLRLQLSGRSQELPPVADGAAFAVLPSAMRARRPLHIDAPVTRSAFRKLREFAEAWACWSPVELAEIEISCGQVVDEDRVNSDRVLAAWAGDLRSTYAVASGDASLSQAGYKIDRCVHVLGLGQPDPTEKALAAVHGIFQRAGIELVVVRTNAAAAGFVDPLIGLTPMVAAALHLVGDGLCGNAVHVLAHPFRGQIIRPRPRPALPDVFGGDRLDILSVGGGDVSAPEMASYVAGHTVLSELLGTCRTSGLAVPRCRHCEDCRLLDLGLVAAGIRLKEPQRPATSYPIVDQDSHAEAILAMNAWSGSMLHRMRLGTRLFAHELRRAMRDRAQWRQARKGRADPWPV